MNAIRQTALLNKRELENATPPSASWHADYRDTAYIYIGGLPLDLSEGDVITIFSQFGNPTHLNLIRDKETGKSKGFGFLKYEDQRSCDLAVDNMGGADVLGRLLRVDHTRYKKKEGEDEDTWRIDRLEAEANGTGKRASDTESEGDGRRKKRKVLREERELSDMLAIKRDGEEEDPMREYLVREKREEMERAKEREKKHKHRHRHKHRDEEEDEEEEEQSRRHRHKHRRRDRSTSDKEGERRSHRGIGEPHHQRQRTHRDKDEHGERRHSRSAGGDSARRHRKERSTRSPAG
jgi:RNA-binding motif protein, X-linked 2